MSPQEISFWFCSEVQPHEDELRGYLLYRIGELSDVEDIIQETFKRIVEVRSKQPVHAPKRLLFRIARNLLVDIIRKKNASNTFFVGEIEDMDVPSKEESPYSSVCRQEEIRALKDAIQTLPPKCRTILLLFRVENLSYKEIADKLNISVRTVDAQLSRGLKKCHQELKRRGMFTIHDTS